MNNIPYFDIEDILNKIDEDCFFENSNAVIPSMLYKYRDWNIENHRQILTESKIWFSSPQDFTDKFDCHPIYDNYTQTELYDYYYVHLRNTNPLLSFCELDAMTRKEVWNSPMRNPLILNNMKAEMRSYFNKTLGVLSLSSNGNSQYLWDNYAPSPTGICIGFDTSEMTINAKLGKVRYVDNLPSISFIKDNPLTQYMKPIFYKHKIEPTDTKICYYREEEFRFFIWSDEEIQNKERLITLPSDCIKQVTVKKEMPEKSKKELKELLNTKNIEIIEI